MHINNICTGSSPGVIEWVVHLESRPSSLTLLGRITLFTLTGFLEGSVSAPLGSLDPDPPGLSILLLILLLCQLLLISSLDRSLHRGLKGCLRLPSSWRISSSTLHDVYMQVSSTRKHFGAFGAAVVCCHFKVANTLATGRTAIW